MIDFSSMRTWPQAGGARLPVEHAHPEEPEEINLEAMVSRALAGEKVAAAVGKGPTQKDIWRHPEAHALVLTLLLLDKYGPDYLEWHPDVLKLTLDRDGIALSNRSWTKILAGRVLLSSPSPWRQWEVFHWVCRGLCGISPNFAYLEEPELHHLVVGSDIMHIVDPRRQTGEEIDKYVAATLQNDGIRYAPTPLDFAQRELDERKIRCKACGAVHRDDNDIKCITCGSDKISPEPGEFDTLRDQTKSLFEKRRNLPLEQAVVGLPEDGVGNAVYRLLVEWDAWRDGKHRMVNQLRMIGRT